VGHAKITGGYRLPAKCKFKRLLKHEVSRLNVYILLFCKCIRNGPTDGLIQRHAVAQWLRHCATNRKVAGSIPDGVTGIFH
jgi:hypothetical protein